MARCHKCKTRINMRTGRCLCNFTTPGSSYNPNRNDPTKWCTKCSSRVMNGKCMNSQCK